MQTSSSTEVDETVGMDGGAEAVVGREVEAAEDAAGKKLTRKERREAKKAAKMIGAQPIDKKHAFKLWLYVAPLLVLVFLFSYVPLFGWIYAFYDYQPPIPLSESKFVGLQWFEMMVQNPAQLRTIGQVLLNTFAMSGLNILTSFLPVISESKFVGLQWFEMMVQNPAQLRTIGQVLLNTFAMSGLNILTSFLPVIFAIALNEIRAKWFKNLIQTLTTLPNFISWVLVYSIAFAMFSSSGMVNELLMNMHLISEPIKFLDSPDQVWLKMLLWNLWKGLGWGSIMYLAGIAGIDPELYEAAQVDGANRFQQIIHVTIPQLMPTYFVLLMLSISNFLNNGMDQYYVFQNAFNQKWIQVLDLYVYNVGMGQNSLSLGTALELPEQRHGPVLRVPERVQPEVDPGARPLRLQRGHGPEQPLARHRDLDAQVARLGRSAAARQLAVQAHPRRGHRLIQRIVSRTQGEEIMATAKVSISPAMRRTTGEKIYNVVNVIILSLFALICAYPFYFLIINSLSSNQAAAAGEVTWRVVGWH